jgi:hypothetical protein
VPNYFSHFVLFLVVLKDLWSGWFFLVGGANDLPGSWIKSRMTSFGLVHCLGTGGVC